MQTMAQQLAKLDKRCADHQEKAANERLKDNRCAQVTKDGHWMTNETREDNVTCDNKRITMLQPHEELTNERVKGMHGAEVTLEH